MKNLFLSSSLFDVAKFLPSFLSGIDKNKQFKSVAFIDVASQIEEYKANIDRAKCAFDELGFLIEMIDFNQSSDDIKKSIVYCDMVYVAGGNTPYLLEKLKAKNLLEQLKAKKIDVFFN
ncbi:Type 1 glutamine amidotransferase-like domain-containing protein [Moraxella nasovis]|uniref:Type 1 glutamine amidotransferase-like domain-containing protein n=1 Tax=Moraxella nasovis TaxID=2904121 RepID=UPI0021131121|nr:Type 1 glutamine amidotransferase-like domain-containing protein [Moraxella nasovis]